MIEIMFQLIALIAYLICGLRIICFDVEGLRHRHGFSILATILIAAFIGQSIHILFLKIPSHYGMQSLQYFWPFSFAVQKVMSQNLSGAQHNASNLKIWVERQ